MSPKTKDRKLTTGYQRAERDGGVVSAAERSRRRAEFIRTVTSLYDAMTVHQEQAEAWQEGFAASTDTTHTIGRTSGDRVSNAALAPYDDVDEKTGETKPGHTREGHGLAERAALQHSRIQGLVGLVYDIAPETYRLIPNHPIAAMRVKHEAAPGGAGTCNGCGRLCVGIRENQLLGIAPDRLKSGYCYRGPGSCYPKWLAAGKPANFKPDPPAGSDEPAGGASLAS